MRQLILFYWLASTVLIGLVFTVISLWDHRRHVVHDGEQATYLVDTALRTPLTLTDRQQLIEAYGQADHEESREGLNVLLVLDQLGTVVYSSRPTLRLLRIEDPLLDQIVGDDPHFRAVVACFRARRSDCLELPAQVWPPPLLVSTLMEKVSMPPADLGLPRQTYLVLANFDANKMVGDFLNEVPALLLLSTMSGLLLTAILWLTISGRVVPQLLEITQTDALTQLMNRTSFMETCIDLLAEAEERQADLVFAILDIDRFKQINDTFGHACGDAALASVGALLLAVTRPEDVVCRFGGEEFALLLSGSRSAGAKALERLRLQLEMNRLSYKGHRVPVTVSIGAAATADCGYNIDYLYNSSDKALYAAKNSGRNRLEWSGREVATRLSVASPKTVDR
ncbi:MAG: diguanylate cyclase [Cyanobium sp.]